MRDIEPGAGLPGRSLLRAKDPKELPVVFLMQPLSTFLTGYTQYESMILNRERWSIRFYYIPRIRNNVKNELSIFHKKLQLMAAIFRIS
jgi:hypothetical protein